MLPSLKDLADAFGFTLSLPERLVRSAAAAVGGASKILTDTVIPEPLRQSNTFNAIIGNAQRFVIEQVAEVQGAYAAGAGPNLPDNYVPRKIAGNLMEAVGLFSVHLSPLWVFAMATDLAHGSRQYLNRLVKELKETKVLNPDVDIKEVDDLLDALGKAGNESAKVFDAPPIDVAQLRQLRDTLHSGYQRVFKEAGDLAPRVDTLWKKVEQLASRDGVGIESIVGLMTVDLSKTAGKAVNAAFAVGAVTSDMLGETILRSYAETIDRVQQRGAIACLDEATRPFLMAIGSHMDLNKETWTERLWGKLTGAFWGSAEPDAAGATCDSPMEATGDREENAGSDAGAARPESADFPREESPRM